MVIIKEYYLDISGKHGSQSGECGYARVWMLHLCDPSLSTLSPGYRAHHSTPVHWFWDFEQATSSHRLDTMSLTFFNCFSGHTRPDSKRIAEVALFRAHTQLVINVGVLGCSWEGSGPGQPRADLVRVTSRSSVKIRRTTPWSRTAGRKVLPREVTNRNTGGEGVWSRVLKGHPCRGRDSVLSQMGILRLMQASCVAWV